jgi:uncharacterized protein
MRSLRGKRILITGASSGIGEEFARQLAGRGVSLVLVARRLERLERLRNELSRNQEISIDVIQADLAEGEELARVADYIRSQHVDGLINNAGRGSFGEFDTIDLRDEVRLLDLNAKAQLVLCHAVIPQLKQRRSGVLIIVSSIAGFQPLPYMATYAATKAFNHHHGLALQQELKDLGISVVTVCPGPVNTEFAGVARVPGEWTDIKRDKVEDVVREAIEALTSGKVLVVPCLRAKILGLLCRALPVKITTFLAGRILKRSLSNSKQQ